MNGFCVYELNKEQLRYFGELKDILVHFKYEVSLKTDLENESVINIKW